MKLLVVIVVVLSLWQEAILQQGKRVITKDAIAAVNPAHLHTTVKRSKKRLSKDDTLCYIENDEESIANGLYSRLPYRKEARTKSNDYYENRGIRSITTHYEFGFEQDYVLKKYSGSKVDDKRLPRENASCYPYSITFVSQMSVERLFYLPYVIQKWEGPISIAVFVHLSELNQTEQFIRDSRFPDRVRLTLYIVDVTSKPDCVIVRNSTYGGCFSRTVYPINRLRNIAIAEVTTSHYVLFDMDVWPSSDTYSILLHLPKRYYTNPYNVMIIPAFSLSPAVQQTHKCKSFTDCVSLVSHYNLTHRTNLVNCLNSQNCTAFKNNIVYHKYLPPNWKDLPESSQYTPLTCIRSHLLEPYVMVRKWKKLPLFDERFINYGFNKMQWFENLRYSGYQFSVLSQGFCIDIPHQPSDFRLNYFKALHREDIGMEDLFYQYIRELREMKDESRTLLCL